jgi:ATP-dependent helicase/DNAse subunit B
MPTQSLYLYTGSFSHFNKTKTSLQKHPFWSLLINVCQKAKSPSTIFVQNNTVKEYVLTLIQNDLEKDANLIEVFCLEDFIQSFFCEKILDPSFNYQIIFEKTLNSFKLKNSWYPEIQHSPGFKEQFLHFWENIQNLGLNKTKYCQDTHFSQTWEFITLFKKNYYQFPKLDFNKACKIITTSKLALLKQKIQDKSLFFIGFYNPTINEKNLLKTLLEQPNTSSLFLPYIENNNLYDGAKDFYKWLQCLNIEVKEIPYIEKKPQNNSKTTVHKLKNLDNELQLIANKISNQTKKISPNDICIVAPNNEYHEKITDTLTAHNIPIKTAFPKQLIQTSLGQFFYQLLCLLETPQNPQALFSFLHNPLIESINLENNSNATIDLSLLEKAINIYNPHKGIRFWEYAFIQYQKQLKTKKNCNILNLETQNKIISSIYKFLNTIQNAPNLTQTLSLLKKSFSIFSVSPEVIDKTDCPTSKISQSVSSYKAISSIIEEFHKIHQTKKTNLETLSLKQTITILKSQIQSQNINNSTQNNNGVSIIRKLDPLLIKPKLLFIPGFIENNWPEIIKENIFYPISVRNKINWPNHQKKLSYDKYLFFYLLNQGQKTIITYPELIKNSQTLSSHFLLILEKIFSVTYSESDNIHSLIAKNNSDLFNKKNTAIKSQQLKSPSKYNGKITLKSSANESTSHLSVSNLELFNKCPYKFFWERIIKEPGSAKKAQESKAKINWGIFIHKILQEFYSKCTESKISFYDKNNLPEANKILANLVSKIQKDFENSSYIFPIKIPQLFTPDKKGLFDRLLEYEFSNPSPFIYTNHEKSFDLQLYHKKTKKTLCIKGSIDAILISNDNQHCTLVDYKTGSAIPTFSDIQLFRSLQLSIYYLALKKLYPKNSSFGSFIYQIKDPRNIEKKLIFSDNKNLESLLKKRRSSVVNDDYVENLENYLFFLEKQITTGDFSCFLSENQKHIESERNKVCMFCQYITICSYNKV